MGDLAEEHQRGIDLKQKEWQEFCADEGFEVGELVYENKASWFVNEQVLDREIRSSRYRNRCTMANSKPIRQTLGIDPIRSYIAAIVDL